MAFKSLKPNATEAEKLAYIKSCRWKLEVQPATGMAMRHPDGREYAGQQVGELRKQHGGNAIKLTAPNGEEQTADLSAYADDDRISVRFMDAPTPEQRNAVPPPGWEPPPGTSVPPGWERTPEGWRHTS